MSGPSTEPAIGELPEVSPSDDKCRRFAAALYGLADFFAAHPEYPVPTHVTLWSHQHGAEVSEIDVFVGQVPTAKRARDHTADSWNLCPDSGVQVDYHLAVYPRKPPT